MPKLLTLALIVGNRGFFPDHLAKEGREAMIGVLEKAGIRVIALTPEQSKFGAVETPDEARRCAELFRKHRDEIDGILVTLPNFGEERGIVDAIRHSTLEVPVLVQATPETSTEAGHEEYSDRRDSFCGKMSACNNLMRVPRYSVLHHLAAHLGAQLRKLRQGLGVVLRGAAASFAAFAICASAPSARVQRHSTAAIRYFRRSCSERSGISVEPLDLSEVFGRIDRLKDTDDAVQAKLTAIKKYVSTNNIPEAALLKMSKLGAVIEGWMKETYCTISAIQCWTSMEEYFGVVPCTVMSMMSENHFASACEVDVCGVMGMHALALASQTPSALLDWNNNYGNDPDKCVCFHCSNLPKHFFEDVIMDFQAIIAGTVGKENTFGTCVGRVKAGAMSFARFSTDDFHGRIRGYVGEGEFTKDPLETFGGAGVAYIPRLQKLLRYICEQGFEHHVAANFSQSASAVYEAAVRYLGWDMYYHNQPEV